MQPVAVVVGGGVGGGVVGGGVVGGGAVGGGAVAGGVVGGGVDGGGAVNVCGSKGGGIYGGDRASADIRMATIERRSNAISLGAWRRFLPIVGLPAVRNDHADWSKQHAE